MFDSFYRGKTVLVTGHTGFKGGWLTTWLKLLGAKVIGFSLPPEKEKPSLFKTAQVSNNMVSIFGDIREIFAINKVFEEHKPEIVFHMAAQSLVRRSYKDPAGTYSTNVLGTVNLLEAVRHAPSVRVAVIITSDKCYENREWVYAYRENDPMGGSDPYSASKGATELVVASYQRSFFQSNKQISLASVRSGNVIGGGDWADDRIIPDIVRAITHGVPVTLRNPKAIRPWQFVLEPLSGYLWLATRMWQAPAEYATAWNFGPERNAQISVFRLVEKVIEEWGAGEWRDGSQGKQDGLYESNILQLDCTKAFNLLNWCPVYSVDKCIQETVVWYHRYYNAMDFNGLTITEEQIRSYMNNASKAGVRWAEHTEAIG